MSSISMRVLQNFESSFFPSEDKVHLGNNGKVTHSYLSTKQKIVYYVSNLFKIALSTLALPVALTSYFVNRVVDVFKGSNKKAKDEHIEVDEKAILESLPKDRGFADSLFQSCALGSKYSKPQFEGRSNWDRWLTKDHVEVKSEKDFPKFFVNYLDDPTALIRILKDMGATSYRFSLERSVIEPKKGKYDLGAIEKYKRLCRELKKNKIEPWITLHHFVEPDWFTKSGGFEKDENVDDFVRYSEFIIPLFKEHVKNWMTFNEPTAFVFQNYILKIFPVEKGKSRDSNILLAGKVLRNLLIAHLKIYQKIKAKHPELQIGIVHQWLKFLPFNKNNPIERLVCYYLSQITHYAVYNFFKTKKFAFQIPGQANVGLTVPKDQKIADFIGFQCYGYPLLKMGTNGGKTYPGYKVKSFSLPRLRLGLTFGSVCREKGKVMSFGMRFNPESLEDALEEASELKIPIAITETGSDANVWHWGKPGFKIDDKTQKEYFEKIFSIIARFRKKMPLKGLFFWTILRGHLEWNRGNNITLGVVNVQKDSNGNILSHELTPAAQYIKRVFTRASAEQRERQIA